MPNTPQSNVRLRVLAEMESEIIHDIEEQQKRLEWVRSLKNSSNGHTPAFEVPAPEPEPAPKKRSMADIWTPEMRAAAAARARKQAAKRKRAAKRR